MLPVSTHGCVDFERISSVAMLTEGNLFTNSMGLLNGDLAFVSGRNMCFSDCHEYYY